MAEKNRKIKKVNKNTPLAAPKKLKLLFTIVAREKCDFYLDVLESFDVSYQLVLYGKGTAPSGLSNMFGYIDPSKAIILSVIKQEKINDVFTAYEDKYFKLKNGRGIAFTVPLSSLIGKTVYQFLTNMKEEF